jgi:hypothetical protein
VEYAITLLVLVAVVALVVVLPIRRPPGRGPWDPRRADLEAAKQAKYREIRDAELDHRMGKLSEDDWRTVDRELRGEAAEILRRLDKLEG